MNHYNLQPVAAFNSMAHVHTFHSNNYLSNNNSLLQPHIRTIVSQQDLEIFPFNIDRNYKFFCSIFILLASYELCASNYLKREKIIVIIIIILIIIIIKSRATNFQLQSLIGCRSSHT